MSYYEGSNWQAKKEDEKKPLYPAKEAEKPLTAEEICPDCKNSVLPEVTESGKKICPKCKGWIRVNLEKEVARLKDHLKITNAARVEFIGKYADCIEEIEKLKEQTVALKREVEELKEKLEPRCPVCDGRGFTVGWENSTSKCYECGGSGYVRLAELYWQSFKA